MWGSMKKNPNSVIVLLLTVYFCAPQIPVVAQEIPADYQAVLTALDRKGDFKADVLKVNIPRNDLKITVQGVSTPTPFGFGGWIALTKGAGAVDVMMGDLVLLQDEVNPVMSALLGSGIDVPFLLGRSPLVLHARPWFRKGCRPRPSHKTGIRPHRACYPYQSCAEFRKRHPSRCREAGEDRWACRRTVGRSVQNYGRT